MERIDKVLELIVLSVGVNNPNKGVSNLKVTKLCLRALEASYSLNWLLHCPF